MSTTASSPVLESGYSRWLERDLVPDWMIRAGIRRLLGARLREESAGGESAQKERMRTFIEHMNSSAVAIETAAANEQHYEVPAEFYALVLGPNRKYSSALYEPGVTDLAAAEEAMLKLTVARAQLADGLQILELGCGWGSLSLFMAARFPASRILAVSNSHSQKAYIDGEAARRGLSNLQIFTCDMNRFDALEASGGRPFDRRFDRIVSVEMFEHMRNWRELLHRIAGWCAPGAKLFIHIFTHSRFAYPFEVRDASDWMAQHFFTGGMMPSDDLLLNFQERFALEEHWRVNGVHYQKTSEAWLANLDRNRAAALDLFVRVYGKDEALKWLVRWRIFFLACAELWGYRNGEEWLVSHYRLQLG